MITPAILAILWIYLCGALFAGLWILPNAPCTRLQYSAAALIVLFWPVCLLAWALIHFAHWLNGGPPETAQEKAIRETEEFLRENLGEDAE